MTYLKSILTRFLNISFVLLLAASLNVMAQDGAPENLSATVNHNGHVVLTWDTPTGQLPTSYMIVRGIQSPSQITNQIYNPTATQFTDYDVSDGDHYEYAVIAVYSSGKSFPAYVGITVLPPPGDLKFISDPQTTAMFGGNYWYTPEVNAVRSEDISYMLVGQIPDGLSINFVVGGLTYLYWEPQETGEFPVTLMATDTRTNDRAIQEFTIKVADRPGTIFGYVRNTLSAPLPNTIVSFWQSDDVRTMKYEVRTDENGYFKLENVQAGQILAYAQPPDDLYAPQWYINARDVRKAYVRTLQYSHSLEYPFYLHPSAPGTPTPVRGRVVDDQQRPLLDARVSFIRKPDFIHIGDTAKLNDWAMETANKWRESLVDTVVTTNFNGEFLATMPLGVDYYTIVNKAGHLSSFVAEQTNALEARAVSIENDMYLKFGLTRTIKSDHKIYGQVRNSNNGVSKQATIVLIDSELKRGAGGGHTYRKYISVVTDSNGVFSIDDLPDSPPNSALLAIPMDPGFSPLYYHPDGGTTNFMQSADLGISGTMQNIDFELRPVKKSGLGSFHSKVTLKIGSKIVPVPGTLIFAECSPTGEIAGYAITDSAGTYSITELNSCDYVLYAENPDYAYQVHYSPAIPDVPMPTHLSFQSLGDPARNQEVNFRIENLVTSLEIDPLPEDLTLFQNYPNPFNPSTTIHFSLPRSSQVTLVVLNALGEEVAVLVNDVLSQGLHSANFNAGGITSGVYFYQLRAEGRMLTKSMMLVK